MQHSSIKFSLLEIFYEICGYILGKRDFTRKSENKRTETLIYMAKNTISKSQKATTRNTLCLFKEKASIFQRQTLFFLFIFCLSLGNLNLQAQDEKDAHVDTPIKVDTLAKKANPPKKQAIDALNSYGTGLLDEYEKSKTQKGRIENVNNYYEEDLRTDTRSYASRLTGIEELDLPPLETFLNAAIDNAIVTQKEDLEEQMRAEYKQVKNDWMDYFELQAYYAYGYFMYTNSYYSEYMPASTQTAQNNYNIGVHINFSIADLVNRKHRIKASRAKINNATHVKDEMIESQKLRILSAYNGILENLATLKPLAETVALYNAQMKVSENNFINGKIDITSLSLERSRRSTAIMQYQKARVALQNAIRTLELLTKIKITKD